jgi:hypothetical protein
VRSDGLPMVDLIAYERGSRWIPAKPAHALDFTGRAVLVPAKHRKPA